MPDETAAISIPLRRMTQAERVKKALLQSVFVEGLPGRGRAPQTFRWGMAPDGWGETSIRSIVTEPVGNGTSPDAARQEPPGFPTLNVSSIRNGRCDQSKISYIELPVKAAADFAAIFDAQEEMLLSLGTQLTAARRVKQSLLQNLLTGKIRLKP